MKKIKQDNFFSQEPSQSPAAAVATPQAVTAANDQTTAPADTETTNAPSQTTIAARTVSNKDATTLRAVGLSMRQASEVLRKAGLDVPAGLVEQAWKDAWRNRFMLCVAGDQGRGKSTFINQLLAHNLLPVSAVPDGRMIPICIRFSQKEEAARLDAKGQLVCQGVPGPGAWKKLTAPTLTPGHEGGRVILGTPNKWLSRIGVELMECPAWQNSKKMHDLAGDMLARCDGAVIVVSATQAMSMTEREFITQRVAAKKIPYQLLALTHMQDVPEKEREKVVDYVNTKLAEWGLRIPVAAPGYKNCTIASIRKVVEMWVKDPTRAALTAAWLRARTCSALALGLETLRERVEIAQADKEKRTRLIADKRLELNKLALVWGELEVKMRERAVDCYKLFEEKCEVYQADAIERLRYQASHASEPIRWWKNDFPYCMKQELVGIAAKLENEVALRLKSDVNWFNMELAKRFDENLSLSVSNIIDKEVVKGKTTNKEFQGTDLTSLGNKTRIGGMALTAVAALTMAAMGLGGLCIVATMGLGTASALYGQKLVKGKQEEQRKEMQQLIAKSVPSVVREATQDGKQRLNELYESVLKEASIKKGVWIDAKQALLQKDSEATNGQLAADIAESIAKIEEQVRLFSADMAG